MKKAIIALITVFVSLFAVTFGIYFFNADMKLIKKVYDALGKHYDNLEKDKKL